ncbi:hypothetical protein RFI_20366, partial [Reticulomyxa filosa]
EDEDEDRDKDEDEEVEDAYIKPYDELPYSEGDDYEKMEVKSISDNGGNKPQYNSGDGVATTTPTRVSEKNSTSLNQRNDIFVVKQDNDVNDGHDVTKVEEQMDEYERQIPVDPLRSEHADEPQQRDNQSVSAFSKKSKNGTTKRVGYDTKHHRYASRYRLKPKRLKYGLSCCYLSFVHIYQLCVCVYACVVSMKGMRQRKKQQNWSWKEGSKYREYKRKYQQLRKWKFPNIFKVYWVTQWLGWLQISLQALFITSYGGISIFKGDPNASPESSQYKTL